ncbi:efflux RND transporter periplasmic adaptor subunit [Neptuniibacter sp. QD37_6]|uniref:efflux RND transporter periplasmic adaptor subunit n=1 Tax=Neptuniibacter sp. QD37_6 TaxID=3398210 RepID=UPI0039F47B05
MSSENVVEDKALATLILLSRRTRRSASSPELRFILVNETQSLVAYQQAAFWTEAKGVEALSGVSALDQQAPYLIWLKKWFIQAKSGPENVSFVTDLNLLDPEEKEWQEWLSPYIANVYIPAAKGFSGGRLMLSRDEPFSQEELSLLQEWADVWSDRYQQLNQDGYWSRFSFGAEGKKRKVISGFVAAAILLIGMLPVNLSVLAPAELIPVDPSVIRSPIDGIVERMLVQPNQRVIKGTELFEFDKVTLDNQLALAQQALRTAQAEYRQKAQRAVFDPESKSHLAVLQSLIDERKIEVVYLRQLLERSVVKSPREGIALLSDETEWVGRPVATGERVLVVADEWNSQVEAWVSPSDLVRFPEQTELTLYLNSDPSVSIHARVSYISHQPELRPEGLYAHRLRAEIITKGKEKYQIGHSGTARIEGEKTSLAYWVFRRPLAAFRGWIGF